MSNFSELIMMMVKIMIMMIWKRVHLYSLEAKF